MKYIVSKGRLRRVRTLAGVKFFGAPIGTLITPGMVYRARKTHGETALEQAFKNEDMDERMAPYSGALPKAAKRNEMIGGAIIHRKSPIPTQITRARRNRARLARRNDIG